MNIAILDKNIFWKHFRHYYINYLYLGSNNPIKITTYSNIHAIESDISKGISYNIYIIDMPYVLSHNPKLFELIIENNKDSIIISLTNIIATQKKLSFYTVTKKCSMQIIYHSDIMYIYRSGKYSIIVTHNSSIPVRKPLKSVYSELQSNNFTYTEQGFIINLEHLNRIERRLAIMNNDISLPISRSRYKIVIKRFRKYISELTKPEYNTNI